MIIILKCKITEEKKKIFFNIFEHKFIFSVIFNSACVITLKDIYKYYGLDL